MFKNHLNLHYSQTKKRKTAADSKFKNHLNLHYSQTNAERDTAGISLRTI